MLLHKIIVIDPYLVFAATLSLLLLCNQRPLLMPVLLLPLIDSLLLLLLFDLESINWIWIELVRQMGDCSLLLLGTVQS